MAYLKTYPLPNSAILRLNAEQSLINVDPWYQRRGEVWTLEKRQLLIDSILNNYDIPKLYFHVLSKSQRKESGDYDYAIIDGRQRLEAILKFADDEFPLSKDFSYLQDNEVKAAGLTYSQLSSEYPKLKIRFDSFTLPIICIETDDIDLIEDMFSRLNEAVPLNAAEKRNAIGGPMAQCIRDLSQHDFFSKMVSFKDNRYQHREVSARLLFIEYAIYSQGKIIDTKKPYLDEMVKSFKDKTKKGLVYIKQATVTVLDSLIGKFEENDTLLRAQASIPVYYLTMRTAMGKKQVKRFSRGKILKFNKALADNRAKASHDLANATFDLLEFDRMSQQGTNDASSIRERTRILCEYMKIEFDRTWSTPT